ncbi:glycoside hydrolase family 1 protein [Candidatus Methylospira mobilis]|uniref:Glycoside hydrolase family 1 protein n=1 Tax=Candidatus Methylospira mobilis TaxID=1808979 RepID=A0A5Q0BE19_9GAMM|nr:family 1 glycosylhydrolase [Candidatus Methylospira mobilis]QFY42060.1 glycoside hydrolase family 1 protein [Candidatus Methylospira mobilis]WNV03067.1 family 1 glycosylhydrolase [Candidatus Methylospira mobilis]
MTEFLWGVATSAYQSEGGYNQPGQPQTNWAEAERKGDVEALGQASDFWHHYREDFAHCRRMGLNAFRLSLEWSRIQPITESARAPGAAPPFDFDALEHYADILLSCREYGLEPIVTLHHFIHPAWLHPDAWLCADTLKYFSDYVSTSIHYINQRLVARKHPPLRYFITINEPGMLVLNTYIGHEFPGGSRSGFRTGFEALSHLLSAHVLAYNTIHDLYQLNRWTQPSVAINSYCSDLYWLDMLIFDLLTLREKQVEEQDTIAFLRERARAFSTAVKTAELPLKNVLFGALLAWVVDIMARHTLNIDQFSVFLQTLRQSQRPRLLDYIAIDYYDPFFAHILRAPAWHDHHHPIPSLRARLIGSIRSKWWDWRVLPEGMHFFCQYHAANFDRPIMIAENGMALRRTLDNTHSQRRDRMSRSRFVRLHVAEVRRIVKEGIPLFGYFHWSLFDNYEWGTYSPRFGLFSVDYQQSMERLAQDHFGDCPSETYSQAIKAKM